MIARSTSASFWMIAPEGYYTIRRKRNLVRLLTRIYAFTFGMCIGDNSHTLYVKDERVCKFLFR